MHWQSRTSLHLTHVMRTVSRYCPVHIAASHFQSPCTPWLCNTHVSSSTVLRLCCSSAEVWIPYTPHLKP